MKNKKLDESNLAYCVQFWSLQYKKRCGQTREGPEKDYKDDQRTRNLPYEERLSKLGLLSLKKA